jgi:hypothetical protein
MLWLKIDAGLPRVLQHRTILPRGPRLERQMAVSMAVSSTQTPRTGLYLVVQFVAVPSVLLESCENIMARSAILFRKCEE